MFVILVLCSYIVSSPDKLNGFPNYYEYMLLSMRKLATTPSEFDYPVYISLKLVFSDGAYAVWPERVLIE